MTSDTYARQESMREFEELVDRFKFVVSRATKGIAPWSAADAARTALLDAHRKALAERDELRAVLREFAHATWEGGDIDGGTFQDAMVDRGLFVKVPATPAHAAEYDSDFMYGLAWEWPPERIAEARQRLHDYRDGKIEAVDAEW